MQIKPPSQATVVAYLALFVALSGTALALQKNSVGPKALKTGAVKTKKIANGAVTNPKLADASVGGPELLDGAITSLKLASDSVGSPQIQPDAVTRGKLANGAVNSPAIDAGAVGTGKLEDGAVTNPKLAPDSVTGANVVAGSLGLSDIAASTASWDPGNVLAGQCAVNTNLTVPGKGAQTVMVLPAAVGWNVSFVLDAYSSTSNISNDIRVRVCNISGGAVDPDALPFVVLLFG